MLGREQLRSFIGRRSLDVDAMLKGLFDCRICGAVCGEKLWLTNKLGNRYNHLLR